jgi:hypothetical protein
VRRAAYDRAMRRLRTFVFGSAAVLLALLVREAVDWPDLPVAITATFTGVFFLAACWLWRYGAGIADVIDRDDSSG